MRRNLKRYYGAGDFHFITCSCYRRQPLLATPRLRDMFLSVLERMRERYQFVVVGYVIMPEHIHLLISEPLIGESQQKNPSIVMQALKLGFARRVVIEEKRRSHPAPAALFDRTPQHIWQKRFMTSMFGRA
jgi:putative transposase